MYICQTTYFKPEKVYYICSAYRHDREQCTTHIIRNVILEEIVLRNLREAIKYVTEREDDFVREASDIYISTRERDRKLAAKKKALADADKRTAELDTIIKRLYEDSVIGKLTDERFCELSRDYESESAELKARVRELQEATASHREANDNSRQFTALIRKYFDVEALDALMLNDLVNKIEVHERELVDGERVQKIDIYYNFVGIIGQETESRTAAYHWVEGMV